MDDNKTLSKFLTIESYLQSLFCESSIETKKFPHTKNYLVRVDDSNGRLKHHMIFHFQFVDENTSDEVIEKLKDWRLEDVAKKAGEKVVFIDKDGIRVLW
jgi:hypothetical protein